jgi:kinesin family protein 11
MKSTLIKDLYGEIDRLKAGILRTLIPFYVIQMIASDLTNINLSAEVYAAREKVGVYIPKDRYHAEENERKVLLT